MKILLAGEYLQHPVKMRPIHCQAQVRLLGGELHVAAQLKSGGVSHG